MEFERRRGWAGFIGGTGAFFVLVGAFMVPQAPLDGKIFFVALGSVMTVAGFWHAFRSAPRFRANAEGVWFGGGTVIPWSAVKYVRVAQPLVERVRGIAVSATVSFEFHSPKTVLRTPISFWLRAPFVFGHVELSPPAGDPVASVVAKLEGMRAASTQSHRD